MVNAGTPLSRTAMVILAVPATVVVGKSVTVQLNPLPSNMIFESGITPWLSEVADTVSVSVAASTSPMVKLTGPTGIPARVTCLAIKEINGGSLTGVTLSVNGVLPVNPLSLCANTVIVFVPNLSFAGVRVRVRLEPVPLMEMSVFKTN